MRDLRLAFRILVYGALLFAWAEVGAIENTYRLRIAINELYYQAACLSADVRISGITIRRMRYAKKPVGRVSKGRKGRKGKEPEVS